VYLETGKFPEDHDAAFDAFTAARYKRPLGTLVGELRDKGGLNKQLAQKVNEVVERRNHLTHHFWRQNAEKFVSRKGRDELIDELIGQADFLAKVRGELHEASSGAGGMGREGSSDR
jgi:hypothetical protein